MANSYIGVDISKRTLEVVERADGRMLRSFQVPNEPAACRQFAKELAGARPAAVVFEATGGYERKLRETLAAEHVEHTLVNPCQARFFAKYKGQLGKTDRIDAGILASMAEEGNLEPTPPPDPEAEMCKALVLRRLQLIEMVAMERNRLQQATSLAAEIRRHIRSLKRQVASVDRRIQAVIADNEGLRNRDQLLRSIKGIGPVTSAVVISMLPEAGVITSKQLAALVGVAPYPADSGTTQGKRFIRGGRSVPRRAIYMAALVAMRHNPQLRTFYRRLVDTGKRKKVALVAVMNKLLRIVTAVLRDGVPWDKHRQESTPDPKLGPSAALDSSPYTGHDRRRRRVGRVDGIAQHLGSTESAPSTLSTRKASLRPSMT